MTDRSVRHHTLWADPRMAEAYDLVDEVIQAHARPDDRLNELRDLLNEIDKADQLLAGTLHEREVA